MHFLLEQLKSVMHHAEAFEEETLRRFKLKLDRHGRDLISDGEEYLYSLVDPDGEDFGCRAILSKDKASFDVFYEDNNECGDRAYSIVVTYLPATHEYTLEIESNTAGRAEVLAVVGPEFAARYDKRNISGDSYALIVAGMARRFAERLAETKGD